MKPIDQDWITDNSEENLARYQRDGQDLSPAINQGQRISDLRDLADISVEELATRSGVSSRELLALEAGLQTLRPALAKRLAGNMGIAYSDLWVNPEH